MIKIKGICYLEDYEEVSFNVEGIGTGEILEINEFNSKIEDDEYQEIEIILSEGISESLNC